MIKLKIASVNRTRITLLASTISAILGTGATHPALAQQPSTLEEVVVTGSRIVRRDLEGTSPIMTVDTQRLDQSSTLSVETILNQMPQFNPAQSQFSAQGEIQTSPVGSLGIGSINLRGVGTNRTLVLVDGRRWQPVNASLIVDTNTIPAAAIERVEVITGGASAVYGSDALAGVVNFVLKDNYQGVSMDAQTNVLAAGDGQETRFTSLLGMNGEKGKSNLLVGVEWYKRDISYQKNRDFFKNGWNDPTNPASTFFPSMAGYAVNAANRPTQAAIDAALPGYAPGTVAAATPGLTFYGNHNGTLFARASSGQTWGFDDSQLNKGYTGDGFYGLVRNHDALNTLQQIYQDGALSDPLTRRSAFAKAHVDINDNLRTFLQANFVRTEVQTFSAGPPPAVGAAWGGSIPNNPAVANTAMPTALQTLLNSRPTNTANWQLNRGLDFLGQFGPTNSSDTYQIVAGLQGSMKNRDWTWEAYYSSGSTSAVNVYYGLPSVSQWQLLVAAPNFGKGAVITSANGVAFGGNYQLSCASGLPIFSGDTSTTSSDCIDSLLGHFKSESTITQDLFEGTLQGKILDMKSGELRFSAGASNRRNSFIYEPSNPQSSVFSYPLGLFVSNASRGSSAVSELFGELLVPVAKKLNVELGYRYSDYSTAAGKVGTSKVQFDYSPTNSVRVRGGFNQASRAPNTAELFQSATAIFETTFSSGDPCGVNSLASWGNVAANANRAKVQQLCAALIGNNTSLFGAPGSPEANNYLVGAAPFTGINGVQQGNTKVLAEQAKTWTVGVVFQKPGKLKGLTASVDFYSIKVTDAIGTFNGFQIYSKCFNSDGVSNPTYALSDPGGFCSLIHRDAGTGGAGTVAEQYLNAGIIDTSGLDLSANWNKDFTGGGAFYMNHVISFLGKYNTQTTPTDPILKYKGTLGNGGEYDYRLNSTFGYRFTGGNTNVGLRLRYLPEVKNGAYVTAQNTPILPTKAYSEWDAFASWEINQKYQLRGGIDNLLDTNPAVVGALPTDSNSASTLAGYYDTLGRRVYVGFKMQF